MPMQIKGYQWRRKANGLYVLVKVPTHCEPSYRRERLLPSEVRTVYSKKSKA